MECWDVVIDFQVTIVESYVHLKLCLLTYCYVSLSGVPTSKKEMRWKWIWLSQMLTEDQYRHCLIGFAKKLAQARPMSSTAHMLLCISGLYNHKLTSDLSFSVCLLYNNLTVSEILYVLNLIIWLKKCSKPWIIHHMPFYFFVLSKTLWMSKMCFWWYVKLPL
jgi:hypothetical protein